MTVAALREAAKAAAAAAGPTNNIVSTGNPAVKGGGPTVSFQPPAGGALQPLPHWSVSLDEEQELASLEMAEKKKKQVEEEPKLRQRYKALKVGTWCGVGQGFGVGSWCMQGRVGAWCGQFKAPKVDGWCG